MQKRLFCGEEYQVYTAQNCGKYSDEEDGGTKDV